MSRARLSLGEVLEATGGELRGAARPDLPLSGVSTDSRRVERGSLFVALLGQKRDGHDFLADAFARRAAAAMVERLPTRAVVTDSGGGPPLVVVADTRQALQALARHDLRHRPAGLIAVVGGSGNTTTADLSAAVLRERFAIAQSEPSERVDLGVPLAVLRRSADTTRIILDLRVRTRADARELVELFGPGLLVINNLQVGPANSAPFDQAADAFGLLLQSLPPAGVAVLNADDPEVVALANLSPVPPIFFGLGPTAGVRAEQVVSHGLQGTELDLVIGRRRVHVRLPLFGENSVQSALAAAGVGLAQGLELREIGAGLQRSSAGPRIIVTPGLNGSRLLDDSHNANPESGLKALNLLHNLDGRKIAVLGGMLGLDDQEAAGHRKVGIRAARVADLLITVGSRARLIAEEARQVGLSSAAIFEAATNEEAADYLRRQAQPGDYVLVKGSPELGMGAIVRAIGLVD